jgi:outer membrane immunogenic protein
MGNQGLEMKKFFFAVALAGVTMTANAAPRTAVAPPIVAPFTFSGLYLGGSIGARQSRVTWTTIDFDFDPVLAVNNPARFGDGSIRIGGYAGYNWLIAPSMLAGLEADIAWGNNSKTHSPFPGTSLGIAPGHDLVTAKLGGDGSIRGRIGLLANSSWLLYATGGAAWQQIKTNSSCDGFFPSFCGAGSAASGSTSSLKSGWTIGGGVEAALLEHWLGRAEYRFADFGHVINTLPPAPEGFHANVKVRTHTMLLGIGYKF